MDEAAPLPERFLAGLKALELTETETKCLRTHLSAPGHSMTMAELGKIVWPSPNQRPHGLPNRFYAALGWKLAGKMSVRLPQDDVIGLTMIGVFDPKVDSRGHKTLKMHASLVQALSEYGFKPYAPDEFAKFAGALLDITETGKSEGWKIFDREVESAELSVLPSEVVSAIERDLGNKTAPEGIEQDLWLKIRVRAAWLANKFANNRRKENKGLYCDECGFDPVERLAGTPVKPRSALDVHHTDPLAEGRRLTTVNDFALLCPTCHRIEHLLLKVRA